MTNILNISVSASLALHSIALISSNGNNLISAKDIAAILCASEAHLHKVLQQLVKTGLVKSIRGPKGGYVLKKNLEDITLLDVFQTIEGPFNPDNCLMETPVCNRKGCIFSNVIKSVNNQVLTYLAKTKMSQISDVFDGDNMKHH